MERIFEAAPALTVDQLAGALRGRRFVALTGAGVSTESGIPDYRSPDARPRRPIQGPEFVRSAALQQRYWARAMVGWERFRHAEPNAGHHALARLEASGSLVGVITQNVDRLHHKAGSTRVTELHGALAEVRCLTCALVEPRDDVQARMADANGALLRAHVEVAPDGDADLPDDRLASFRVPTCVRCDGVLKPNVVFFGDAVPARVVDEAFARLAEADALLVLGTSLAVYSGYRFLLRAVERRQPVYIVNRGPVRGEDRAVGKVSATTGATLGALARALVG